MERLTCYQYSLVSLVPLLLRNLKDVGAASLNSGGGGGSRSASLTNLASIDPLTTGKVKSFNMPLQLFGQVRTKKKYWSEREGVEQISQFLFFISIGIRLASIYTLATNRCPFISRN